MINKKVKGARNEDPINAELQKALERIKELENQLLRSMADLQNIRKRAGAERVELLKNGGLQVIEKILPTFLYFDQAVKTMPKELQDNNWAKGILAIEKMLFDILKEEGLQEISSVSVPFDSMLHEAVVIDKEQPKDIVSEILEKGYKLNGKVIKVARVKVGGKEVGA